MEAPQWLPLDPIGCRHSAGFADTLAGGREPTRMVDADPSHRAGHGRLRQALPPPFGRWADAPPLRCGLSPTSHSEPVRVGEARPLFFFSLLKKCRGKTCTGWET